MQHISSGKARFPAPARPPRPEAAGQRSGQGAASVLPPLNEDAAQRPGREAPPAQHPDGTQHAARAGATPHTIGRYPVSPLIRLLEDGWFSTSVSIRSGSGSATTDRVLRLPRLFQCAEEAVAYARAEGLQWITAPCRPTPI